MKTVWVVCILLIWSGCKTISKPNQHKITKARIHFIIHIIDSTKEVSDYYNDAWYLDSCVIFQVNQQRGVDNMDTSRKTAILETMNYSFINLRNFKCQDYIEFSVNSIPISNYKLGKEDTILKDIFKITYLPPEKWMALEYTKISDTITATGKYQRFQAHFTVSDSVLVNRIAFIKKEQLPPYFHNYDFPFKLNSNEMVIKIDDYYNGIKLFTNCVENLTKQLTPYDEKVFAKWKENSEHTQLPLITATEATKILGDTLFQIDLKRFNYFRPAK